MLMDQRFLGDPGSGCNRLKELADFGNIFRCVNTGRTKSTVTYGYGCFCENPWGRGPTSTNSSIHVFLPTRAGENQPAPTQLKQRQAPGA